MKLATGLLLSAMALPCLSYATTHKEFNLLTGTVSIGTYIDAQQKSQEGVSFGVKYNSACGNSTGWILKTSLEKDSNPATLEDIKALLDQQAQGNPPYIGLTYSQCLHNGFRVDGISWDTSDKSYVDLTHSIVYEDNKIYIDYSYQKVNKQDAKMVIILPLEKDAATGLWKVKAYSLADNKTLLMTTLTNDEHYVNDSQPKRTYTYYYSSGAKANTCTMDVAQNSESCTYYSETGQVTRISDGNDWSKNKSWYDNGKVQEEYVPDEHIKNALWKIQYTETGDIEQKELYIDKKQRSYLQWTNKDTLSTEWNFDENQKRDGIQRAWYSNGQQKFESTYSHGRQIKYQVWDENGTLIDKCQSSAKKQCKTSRYFKLY